MLGGDGSGMKRGRANWFGFALGVLPIPLGFFVPASVPVVHGLVSILTTPGVLVTLLLHNAMAGGVGRDGAQQHRQRAPLRPRGVACLAAQDGCVSKAPPRQPSMRTSWGRQP